MNISKIFQNTKDINIFRLFPYASSDYNSEDAIKDGESEIQKITDLKISRIDEIIKSKETELTTI